MERYNEVNFQNPINSLQTDEQLVVARKAVGKLNFVNYNQARQKWYNEKGSPESGKWKLTDLPFCSYGYVEEKQGFFVFDDTSDLPLFPICPIQPCENFSYGTRRCKDHHDIYYQTVVNYFPRLPKEIRFPVGKGRLLKNGVYNVKDIKQLFAYLYRKYECTNREELLEKLGHYGARLPELGVVVNRYRDYSGSLYITRLDLQGISKIVCSGKDCFAEAMIDDDPDAVCSEECRSIKRFEPVARFTPSCTDRIKKLRDYLEKLAIQIKNEKGFNHLDAAYSEIQKDIYLHGERGVCYDINGHLYVVQVIENGQTRVKYDFKNGNYIYVCQYLDCLQLPNVKGRLLEKETSKKVAIVGEKFFCAVCEKKKRVGIEIDSLFKDVQYGKKGHPATIRFVVRPLPADVKHKHSL